jgi:hypothetical protein
MMIPNPSYTFESSPPGTDQSNPVSATLSPREVSRWSWSASPYSLEMLSSCKHQYELEASQATDCGRRRTYVHLDSSMMGVGGYDSWSPSVDYEHLIVPLGYFGPSEYFTSVLLVPLNEGQLCEEVYADYNCGKYASLACEE